jgi:hypothetical protein
MMLNIDSEPMATPITNPRRAKKLRSTSGTSARDSTISSERGRRQYERADDGERCRPHVRQCMQPEDQRHHDVASKTRPVQSARRPCVPSARAVAPPAEARPAIAANMQDVEPENHAPARDVGERAAEQRPDAEAEHQKPGPSADGCSPALRRRAGVDRSQSAGHRECCREAL